MVEGFLLAKEELFDLLAFLVFVSLKSFNPNIAYSPFLHNFVVHRRLFRNLRWLYGMLVLEQIIFQDEKVL